VAEVSRVPDFVLHLYPINAELKGEGLICRRIGLPGMNDVGAIDLYFQSTLKLPRLKGSVSNPPSAKEGKSSTF
jgi:hypothetical protein